MFVLQEHSFGVLVMLSLHHDDMVDKASGKLETALYYNSTTAGLNTVDKL